MAHSILHIIMNLVHLNDFFLTQVNEDFNHLRDFFLPGRNKDFNGADISDEININIPCN